MATQHTSGSDFFRKQLSLFWLVGAILAIALILGFSWWNTSSVDPQKVFWGMLDQSLATNSVTLNIAQSSDGAGTQELVQLGFGATKQARTITTLTQDGATAKTELYQTPTHSYTQYLSITSANNASGKSANFSNILHVWADTSGSDASKDKGLPSIFSQVLLSLPVPFGNLSNTQRSALVQEIQQNSVYATSFTNVKKQYKAGRLQYIYTVDIEPVAYVRLMQDYGDDMGMHELDHIDPAAYVSQAATTVKWTVDARARQLVGVAYVASGNQETYGSYDVPISIGVPAHPISSAALQARLAQAL